MKWYLKITNAGILAFREDSSLDKSRYDALLPLEYSSVDISRVKLIERLSPDSNGFSYDVIIDNIKERDILQSVEDEKWERLQGAVDQFLNNTDWALAVDSALDAQSKTDYTNYRSYLRDFMGLVAEVASATVLKFDEWKLI